MGTSIPVTEAVRDELRDEKPEDKSWSDFLSQLAGNYDGGVSGDIPAEVREQLDRIEASASAAEDRTGSIQRTVEDMEGRMR